jgi:hypothetical protein
LDVKYSEPRNLFVILGTALVTLAVGAEVAQASPPDVFSEAGNGSFDLAKNSALDPGIQTPSLLASAAAAGIDRDNARSSGNRTRITLTPRVWVTQVNTVDFDEVDPGAYFVPMYGASLEIAPPDSGFSIVATGFYGEGEGDVESLALGSGDSEVTRADVELLLRYRVPNTQLILFGGPRYVFFDQELDVPGRNITEESDIIVGEIGVGTFGNLGESGRHRFFGNFMLGVAASFYEFENGFAVDEDSGTEVTGSIDVNVGYEYLVTGWASINLRYRMFLFFGEDDFGQDDMTTVHGPEFGVAFRF